MRHHKDVVLANAREGANRTGRAYAVMYDLSGLPAGGWLRFRDDWRMPRDRMHITEDPARTPRAGPWSRSGASASMTASSPKILARGMSRPDPVLKADGCTVMLGVATGWREQKRDAMDDPELHAVLQKADIISPWTLVDIAILKASLATRISIGGRTSHWCDEHEMDYLPVVFPGFSWHHLKGDWLDKIPRRKANSSGRRSCRPNGPGRNDLRGDVRRGQATETRGTHP